MAGKNPSRGKEDPEQGWDLKEIRQLIDLLIEREIAEFEMEKGGLRIRIKRGDATVASPARAASNLPAVSTRVPAPAPPAAVPVASVAPAPTVESTESPEGLHIIKSPIVGTFYAAPSPTAPPFVKPGDGVQVGQVLCIIEAMKLMNEIESEVAGEVVRVYVENGQPVEYGQSLFAIKPSPKK